MLDPSILDDLPIINPDELTDWPAFTTAPGVQTCYRLETLADLLYNLNDMTKEALAFARVVSVREADGYYWFTATAPASTSDTTAATT